MDFFSSLLIKLIRRLRIVLISHFVYRFFLAFALEEPVRAVYHEPFALSHIPVGVHDPLGHDHYRGVRLSGYEPHPELVSRGFGPVVPEKYLEVRRPGKAEVISLIDMLVRPPGNARLGKRDVGHYRMVLAFGLVGAEELHEPAAFVSKPLQLFYDNPLYRSLFEHALYLHHGIVAYHQTQGFVLVVALSDLRVPAYEAVLEPVDMVYLRAGQYDAVLD